MTSIAAQSNDESTFHTSVTFLFTILIHIPITNNLPILTTIQRSAGRTRTYLLYKGTARIFALHKLPHLPRLCTVFFELHSTMHAIVGVLKSMLGERDKKCGFDRKQVDEGCDAQTRAKRRTFSSTWIIFPESFSRLRSCQTRRDEHPYRTLEMHFIVLGRIPVLDCRW